MTTSKYAIVAIGFNRIKSFQRLCNSLIKVKTYGDTLDLVISLDFCEDKALLAYSEELYWDKGKKIVIFHDHRMGLRNHILSCGKLLDQYEAIAVLEDDIVVSSQMYFYMRKAVEKYQNDNRIAGIALYNYGRNEFNGLGFQADASKYDTYFIQLAQSWGQIWMRNQWNEFYRWYVNNFDSNIIQEAVIHPKIKEWNENSWLKFHITYCVLKDKYFVYPYKSLTSCFSELGTHMKYSDITQQVPLYEGDTMEYRFADISDTDSVIYDAFYERIRMNSMIMEVGEKKRLCVDFYGDKYVFDNFDYILTTRKYSKIPIRSFGLIMKPWENNIKFSVEGKDIFLYEINEIRDELGKGRDEKMKKWQYFSSPKMASDINMVKMYVWKLIKKYWKG